MRRLGSLLVAASAGSALCAGAGAAPALAGTAAGCPAAAKASFARVQLFSDANCRGASVVVPKTGDGNRPDLAAFTNYDGSVRDADDSRSSLAIDRGTCVRLFDGKGYTGPGSTPICARSGVLFWNLDRFDDRASSMRVCAVTAEAGCNSPGPGPAPAPAPVPAPRPVPAFNPDPMGFGGPTVAEKKRRFYAKMAPLARSVHGEFGVPTSFILAQAASESAYGLKDFDVKNFFGIKCPLGPSGIPTGCTSGSATTEYYGGVRHTAKGSFRTYRTVLDSVRDQGSLLRRKYAAAFAFAADPDAFARAVQRGHYATDPQYARTLIAIMRVNDLYRFDR